MSSRLQTLEELLADNSPRLTAKGKKILEELTKSNKTPIDVEVTVTEPEIHLEETKTFDARELIWLKAVRGKTKTSKIHVSTDVQEPPRLRESHFPAVSTDIHEPSRLRESQLVLENAAKLINDPRSVHSINDEVWTCQDNGILQLFDRNLECLRKFTDQQWGDVCDVTELSNKSVVLAGHGGLYHITTTGETKTAIDTVNKYYSSVILDDNLFAYCYDPPRLIVYTMRKYRWEKCNSISLARAVKQCAYVTLATANGKIFACSDEDDKVFVLSQSGKVLQTHGKPGSGPAGRLRKPFLCAVDSEESMLVADRGNDRLQVCDRSGQWSVLDLQLPV